MSAPVRLSPPQFWLLRRLHQGDCHYAGAATRAERSARRLSLRALLGKRLVALRDDREGYRVTPRGAARVEIGP